MAIDQTDFDLQAPYNALDEQRRARQMSWAAVASAVNGLRTRQRAVKAPPVNDFPRVMRLVRWLDRPAAAFTRIADW